MLIKPIVNVVALVYNIDSDSYKVAAKVECLILTPCSRKR